MDKTTTLNEIKAKELIKTDNRKPSESNLELKVTELELKIDLLIKEIKELKGYFPAYRHNTTQLVQAPSRYPPLMN